MLFAPAQQTPGPWELVWSMVAAYWIYVAIVVALLVVFFVIAVVVSQIRWRRDLRKRGITRLGERQYIYNKVYGISVARLTELGSPLAHMTSTEGMILFHKYGFTEDNIGVARHYNDTRVILASDVATAGKYQVQVYVVPTKELVEV